MSEQRQAQGTILDAVGRAKHTLAASRVGGAASVTVHGPCPLAECRALTVAEVRADTTSITCASCGRAFDV